jgi:hypothetical protein
MNMFCSNLLQTILILAVRSASALSAVNIPVGVILSSKHISCSQNYARNLKNLFYFQLQPHGVLSASFRNNTKWFATQ